MLLPVTGTINCSSTLKGDLVFQVREAISNSDKLKISIKLSIENKEDGFIQSMIDAFHNGWEAFINLLGPELLEVAPTLYELLKPYLG